MANGSVGAAVFQELAHNRAQRHGQDRFVQEVMAERVHLAEALRRGIATDEECWDRGAQALAQLADRDEAVLSAEQVVVGNNEIGHTRKASQTCKSFAHRCDADYLASPTCQQLAGAVQDEAVVVDHDDDLAGHRISRYPELLDWAGLPPVGSPPAAPRA